MKLTTHKQDMSKATELVARAASRKSDIATLESILIKAEDNEITLTAYNMSTGITAEVEGRIAEEGAICLDAKTFTDIVKKLPNSMIEIEVEKSQVKISSGDTEFVLSGLDAVEFPDLPKVEEDESFTLGRELLTSAIRQTVFSAAKTDTGKVVHTGVRFHAYGGLLRFVSTDGFRLSYRETALDIETDFVVPAEALYELLKIIAQTDEDVTIYKSNRHISFKNANYTLISRLLEGDFLNYQSVFPTSAQMTVKVSTIALQEALERVSIIVSDKLASPIKAVFSDNSIQLEVTTATGKAEERLDAKIESEEVTIGFNSAFFNEALKAIEEEEVVIKLNDAVSPIIFQPVKGEHFKYLVLPVRLKK